MRPASLLFAFALLAPAAWAARLQVLVTAIEDGDTLVAQVDGISRRLQLAGIDAPEDRLNPKLRVDLQRTGLDQAILLALGRAAGAHLAALAPVATRLEARGDLSARDRYGRTPVELFDAGGRSINQALVAGGYAVVLRKGALDPELRHRLEAAETRAREAREGLWGDRPRAMAAWAGDR